MSCPRCSHLTRELDAARLQAVNLQAERDEARTTASTLLALLESVADRLTPDEGAQVAQAMTRAVR